MNFLNFLTSGANLLNFNLQNIASNISSSLVKDTPSQKGVSTTQPIYSEPLYPTVVSSNSIESSDNMLQKIANQNRIELINQHQQLINQYMHLNIQLLSKKIQTLEHSQKIEDPNSQTTIKNNKKKIKKMNSNCGHNDKEHYAKGMCNNCYHKNGRTKKPWNCPHQKLYANGMCQNCYINKYNKMKREKPGTQEDQYPDVQAKIEQNQS